jgi:hypothetical protein
MKQQLRAFRTTEEVEATLDKTVWPSTQTAKFGVATTMSLEINYRATEVIDARCLRSNCTRWATETYHMSASVAPLPPMAVPVCPATRAMVAS